MTENLCAIDGCERKRRSRGWCTMHHRRWLRHGNPTHAGWAHGTESARFWTKVNKDGPLPKFRPELGPCWIWLSGRTPNGYGTFALTGGAREPAHRWSYKAEHGEIAEAEIDHLCRVPLCVNPSHLEPVSRRENGRRGIKGVLTTHCPQGHEYNEANTYHPPQHPTWRQCRICHIERRRVHPAPYRVTIGMVSQ